MKRAAFIPGQTYIPASGKVFDEEEINNAIAAARDCWWTEGRFAKQFEKDFSKYLGANYVSLTNSGSSANLLAVASLTSTVFGEKRLKRGDEFITTPVAFPTTVNPGIIYGLKPVFIDIDLKTLNIDADKIEKAITKRTKLIMLAHTLGIPFSLDKIMRLVKKYDLWLIEDCCDALGSRYDGKLCGTFGHIATFSFYPAHLLCMGEGGATVTNNPLIHRSIRQFRDWGRDCWCDTGRDNTCGKRFSQKFADLPYGYDHKYIYSQIGYNLKLTDFQAAIGLAQLKKLPYFIKKRKENYRLLYGLFKKYSMEDEEIKGCKRFFLLPFISPKLDPCWFGFPVIVHPDAPFTRNEITKYLEEHKIGTRTVFAGNLLRHPAYKNVKYKVVGSLKNADLILNNAFWIGVYPGIDQKQINYIKSIINAYFHSFLTHSSK